MSQVIDRSGLIIGTTFCHVSQCVNVERVKDSVHSVYIHKHPLRSAPTHAPSLLIKDVSCIIIA